MHVFLSVFVVRSFRTPVSFSKEHPGTCWAKFLDNSDNDAIDPLEGVRPAPQRNSSQPPPPVRRRASDPRPSHDDDALLSEEMVNSGSNRSNTQVTELLEAKLKELEGKRAATLPTEVLVEFQSMMQRGVPIIALFMLAEHVALLLPVLYKLKQDYDVSIIPFLYIGPALYILPYVIFFLWEYNVAPIPYIDGKFYNFVRYVKRKGTEEILKHNDTLTALCEKDLQNVNLNVLTNIALSRALSKIDCHKVYTEGLAIRRQELQAAKNYVSTDEGGLGMKAINKKDGSLK